MKKDRDWPSYAWPGGYPIYYVTRDGGILCPDCANKNLALTLGDDPQWSIEVAEINYEEFITCDNCDTVISCAYGDDTDDQEEEEEEEEEEETSDG